MSVKIYLILIPIGIIKIHKFGGVRNLGYVRGWYPWLEYSWSLLPFCVCVHETHIKLEREHFFSACSCKVQCSVYDLHFMPSHWLNRFHLENLLLFINQSFKSIGNWKLFCTFLLSILWATYDFFWCINGKFIFISKEIVVVVKLKLLNG